MLDAYLLLLLLFVVVCVLQDYSKSLHFVGRCASVEQFWSLYCHLVRPSSLKPFRELHMFKSGIKPMWEDPCNAKGGKWVIRLRKNRIDRAWENACMAMLGEQFLVGPEICGIVLSTRFPVSLRVSCSVYTKFAVFAIVSVLIVLLFAHRKTCCACGIARQQTWVV